MEFCVPARKKSEEVSAVFDFKNKKTKKIVSSIIVILLVLAMVAPVVLGALRI